MSLVSLAVRIIARKAMTGRTWAAQVMDQPVDPISELLRGPDNTGKPVIAIYTQSAVGKPVGLETQGGPQKIDLKVFIYIPPAKVVLPESVTLSIDNTGAGLALDVIGRQVDAAFHFGNEIWVKLFRRFVLRADEVKSQFVLVEIENTVRIPCLEVSYDFQTVAEPEYGTPLYGAWAELDAALRADNVTEGVALADLIKGMIEAPAGLLEYADFQMNLGLTDAALRSTGVGPVEIEEEPVLTEEGELPPLNDVGSDIEIETVPPPSVP